MVSLRYQFATTFAAGLLARAALAQDANQILYPDVADLTFHYLDTVNVAYSTDYAEPWLYLWCWDQNNARQQIVYYSPSELTGKTSLAVQLTSNTEFTGSPCWFNLASAQIAGDEEVGVKSVEFNYVKEEGSKQTWGLGSTNSTSTSASITSATSAPSSTATTIKSTYNQTTTAHPTTSATSSSNQTASSPTSTVVLSSASGMGQVTSSQSRIALGAFLVAIGFAAVL